MYKTCVIVLFILTSRTQALKGMNDGLELQVRQIHQTGENYLEVKKQYLIEQNLKEKCLDHRMDRLMQTYFCYELELQRKELGKESQTKLRRTLLKSEIESTKSLQALEKLAGQLGLDSILRKLVSNREKELAYLFY